MMVCDDGAHPATASRPSVGYLSAFLPYTDAIFIDDAHSIYLSVEGSKNPYLSLARGRSRTNSIGQLYIRWDIPEQLYSVQSGQ